MGKKGKGKKKGSQNEPVSASSVGESSQQSQSGPQQSAGAQQQPPASASKQPGARGSQQPGPGGPQQPGPRGPQQPGPEGPQQPGPGGPQQPGPRGPQQPGPGGPQQPGPRGPQKPAWGQQPAPGIQQPIQPQQFGPGIPQQPGPRGPQQPGPRGPQKPAWGQQPAPGIQQPIPPQQFGPGIPQQPGPRGPQKPAWGQQPAPGIQQPIPPQQFGAGIPQQPGPRGPQQPGPGGPQQPGPGGPQHVSPQQSGPGGSQQQAGTRKSQQSLSEPDTGFKKSIPSAAVKASIPADLALQYMLQIPSRSNLERGGTMGRKITVETNMFKLLFGKDFQTSVSHYDVVIQPDRPKFLMRPVFEKFRDRHFPNRYPGFDGKKNAYSAQDLPFGHSKTDEVVIFDEESQQEKSFMMTLTKVADIDLSWLKNVRPGFSELERNRTAMQVLDVILSNGPANNMITVGRSLFQAPKGQVVSLSNGLDLWVGVFQSATIGWKPYVNIDVAHKGFPTPQPVLNLLEELCIPERDRQSRNLSAQDIWRKEQDINKFLRGLKVLYEIPGKPTSKRTQRVNCLVECPRKNRFTSSDGKEITVETYFNEKGYRIRYPDYPCLWIGSRNGKCHVPVELCSIVRGQAVQRKLDDKQTANMVKTAATGTQIRKNKIMEGFANLRLNEYPTMKKEFNLAVDGKFETVPARVLDPPKLRYDRQVNVSRGTWHAGRFLNPCNLEPNSWTILNLNPFTKDRDLYAMMEKFTLSAKDVGMSIGNAATPFTSIAMQRGKYVGLENYFENAKINGMKLVIVVIPDRQDIAYSTVKQITELKVGVLTQCIKGSTLERRMDRSTVQNIFLKINSKLNGVNHAFLSPPACLQVPCMIVGADVTHPSPDAIDIPSIATVAASHCPRAFQYNIEMRLQPPRTEIVQDLQEIMRSQLIFFYKQTGHKPLKIIFYRDGVSEGQIPQVMHHEIAAIKRACKMLQADGKYNPPITFLIVQKRHHIRLFPTDPKNSDDAAKNFNVQAGTIVDTHITHPRHIDFYLVSHASIKGTARPTKYRCLCNENNMSEDDIEQLTFYLCHMFSRCTRAVSYPAPTYYAHLAGLRARALTLNVPIQMDDLQKEQKEKLSLQVHRSMPMFFV